MTKKERVKLILELLNKKGMVYEVLSKSGSIPNHIRVVGFGDIWPSTGTHRIGSKFYKRDLNRLIAALDGERLPEEKSSKQLIADMEKMIEQLLDRIESLEDEVGEIKHNLSM